MLHLQTQTSTCIPSVATRTHAYTYPQKAKRAAFPACKRIFVSPCSIAYTSRHRFRRIVFQSFSRHSTKHTVGEPGHTEKQHKVVRNVTPPNTESTCIPSVATRIYAYAYPQKAKRAASPASKRILSSPCSIAYLPDTDFDVESFSLSVGTQQSIPSESPDIPKNHKVVRNATPPNTDSTCIRAVATRIHAYAYPQKAKRAASPACKRILSSPCSIASCFVARLVCRHRHQHHQHKKPKRAASPAS